MNIALFGRTAKEWREENPDLRGNIRACHLGTRLKTNDIVGSLREQGEKIDEEILSHISLLPFKHVLSSGTYFIEDK